MQSDYPGVERNKPQGTSNDVLSNALDVAASPAIRRDDNLNQAGVSKRHNTRDKRKKI
jgi:hypothetical protein